MIYGNLNILRYFHCLSKWLPAWCLYSDAESFKFAYMNIEVFVHLESNIASNEPIFINKSYYLRYEVLI